MSFNGYEALGSFEAAPEKAQAKEQATLRDLRNELFIHCRALGHRNDNHFVFIYKTLKPLLKIMIEHRENHLAVVPCATRTRL